MYGIHTARALVNFPLTSQPFVPVLMRGMALIQQAGAQTNTRFI